MHYGISQKIDEELYILYTYCIIMSKVSEEIATENAENCRCRRSHSRLTPSPRDPREYPHLPYISRI